MRLCYSIVLFMALIMLTTGLSLITACGKKGPLYHPVEAQTAAGRDSGQQKDTKKPTSKAKQP